MRKYIDIINEKWENTVDAFGYGHTPKVITVDIFRNPSRSEFFKLIRNSQYQSLRALLSGDDLLVWDAGLTTHGDIMKHYPHAESITLLLEPSRVLWTDINSEYNDEDDSEEYPFSSSLKTKLDKIHNCSTLRHLYGEFTVIGLDENEQHFLTPEWVTSHCRPY